MGRKNVNTASKITELSVIPSSPQRGPKDSVEVSSTEEENGGKVLQGNGVEIDSYVKKGRQKRIFRPKDSILTELAATDKNMEAFYHAFTVMIVTAIAYSLLKDTLDAGEPSVDLAYYFSGFGPAQQQLLSVLVWVPLQLAAFTVYPAFRVWQYLRPRAPLLTDVTFVILAIIYNLTAHSIVVSSIMTFNLFPVPAVVLSIEQLRFTMKSYSYIRENVYKVLHPWNKDDDSGPAVWYAGQMEPQVGSFSHYCYFLFSPTLLYRDNYPRNPRIRKLRVLSHLGKCVMCVAFVTILVKEIFDSYPISHKKALAYTFLSCMLWGLVLQFMAGYFFLHSWCNLFSEVLRFADREFYSDWWTCISFSSFYRKWNLLVHDWIKAYIYQDLKDLFRSKAYNRVATIPAMLISALIHEYVLWAPVRFVLPVLLLEYCTFGVLLYFYRPSSQAKYFNYFLHFGLNFGVSSMVFCYATEFHARKMCVKEENFVNTFVPRFYECFIAGTD